MGKYFLFGFLMSTLFVSFRLIPELIRTKFSKEKNKQPKLDGIELFVEWSFYFVVFLSFISIVNNYGENKSIVFFIVIGILCASLLLSFSFIVAPVLMLFRIRKYQKCPHYENILRNTFKKDIHVRILNENRINAYATGIIPNMKFILLGKPLLSKMEERDLTGLLFHEYAHIKFKHVFILFLTNICICTTWVISAILLYPFIENSSNPGLWVALEGGAWGGILVVICNLVQRKLEYHADTFAAEKAGQEAYANTLIKLNEITNGGLEKKAINYPSLEKRLENVRKTRT